MFLPPSLEIYNRFLRRLFFDSKNNFVPMVNDVLVVTPKQNQDQDRPRLWVQFPQTYALTVL